MCAKMRSQNFVTSSIWIKLLSLVWPTKVQIQKAVRHHAQWIVGFLFNFKRELGFSGYFLSLLLFILLHAILRKYFCQSNHIYHDRHIKDFFSRNRDISFRQTGHNLPLSIVLFMTNKTILFYRVFMPFLSLGTVRK